MSELSSIGNQFSFRRPSRFDRLGDRPIGQANSTSAEGPLVFKNVRTFDAFDEPELRISTDVILNPELRGTDEVNFIFRDANNNNQYDGEAEDVDREALTSLDVNGNRRLDTPEELQGLKVLNREVASDGEVSVDPSVLQTLKDQGLDPTLESNVDRDILKPSTKVDTILSLEEADIAQIQLLPGMYDLENPNSELMGVQNRAGQGGFARTQDPTANFLPPLETAVQPEEDIVSPPVQDDNVVPDEDPVIEEPPRQPQEPNFRARLFLRFMQNFFQQWFSMLLGSTSVSNGPFR